MARIDTQTRFRDVEKHERKSQQRMVHDRNALLKLEDDGKALSYAQREELERLNAIYDVWQDSGEEGPPLEKVDPLFVATRTLLNDNGTVNPRLLSHIDGVFEWPSNGNEENIRRSTVRAALTLGILAVDRARPPRVVVVAQSGNQTGRRAPGQGNGRTLYADETDPKMAEFTREFFEAIGEMASYGQLAENVFAMLASEGDPDGIRMSDDEDNVSPTVDVAEFARVMRRLAKRNVAADEPQLRRRVNEALDDVQNVGSFDKVASSSIELPDLEELTDTNIVEENIRVMGPMIVSTMFEELKVYQVVDRIVEQFQRGMLPIGSGEAGELLYDYWREAPNRMSEQERRDFQMITLGVPGGNPNSLVNRDFNDLWLRFVSSVSSFVRQNEVDTLLRSATPGAISQQQVRKAARDLASNLTLHGYGMAHYAARELQSQIKFMIKLLQDPEILGAYGARDMWQVIDQVATYDLGGAKTSSRYRTLATCGTIICEWLGKNAVNIARATGPIIDLAEVRNPQISQGPGHKATVNPTDYDLVNACELWLADTATSDAQIEELAQPREAPVTTSKPIPIPALARDMLDGIGVGLGGTRH